MKNQNKIVSKLLGLALLLTLVMGLGACSKDSADSSGEGSSSANITVVSREDGSGTRGAFVELTGVIDGKNDMTTQTAVFQDGNGKVIETVKNDPNALGYASLGSVLGSEEVKVLKVDGIEASSENILDDKYSVARPFNIAWKKGEDQTPQAEDFVRFIFSKEGQEIVSYKDKYITIDPNAEAFNEAAKVEGEIMVTGSTSVAPLMEKLAEGYMKINPDVVIKVSSTGSSAGMKDAINGNNDIGMASRELKDDEKVELEYSVIAKDGIAMIVNPANKLDDISLENIKKIYRGELSKWEELK